MPTFDPEVTTHILSLPDAKSHILRAVGVDHPKKIPRHIPTLSWNWAISRMLGSNDLFMMHELFAERLDEPIVGCGKRPPRKSKNPPPPKPMEQQDSSDIE